MISVHVQPQASIEAADASVWYEAQRPGLGTEFVLELDAAMEKAAEMPTAFAVQYRDARRILLRRFPYAVYFTCEDDKLEVFAILHQRGNPETWQQRMGQ